MAKRLPRTRAAALAALTAASLLAFLAPARAFLWSKTPPEFGPGKAWINSEPLTMAGLRGKVVLIDFMEYTCINCIRTFPYLKAWHKKYAGDGLVIVGVHTPEFKFARSAANVERAVRRFGLTFPVVNDADRQIWNAYGSTTWPNKYLIGRDGKIAYNHSGEGEYGEFEGQIRKLLQEGHPQLRYPEPIKPDKDQFGPGCGQMTGEVYVGNWTWWRGAVANPEGYKPGAVQSYRDDFKIDDGEVALQGKWRTTQDAMIYEGEGQGADHLALAYHAREIYSVMNLQRGKSARLYVLLDGKPVPRDHRGVDLGYDEAGRSYIQLEEPRMYYLAQHPRTGPHRIELVPTAPGIAVNSFTFGNDCLTDFEHL